MNVALIAGAKVEPFFETCKFIFGNFYLLSKLAFCQDLLMNFAVIASAKVEPFSVSASFILTFFETFPQDTGKQNPAIKLFLSFLETQTRKAGKTKEMDCKTYEITGKAL